MNKFKIKQNNLKKGGANTEYNSSFLVNTSNPVDAHFSTGSLEQPSKTEFKNTHGCPFVVVSSHKRNGGENDVKTKSRASKVLTSPNLNSQETELLNKCNSWSKYVSTFEAKYEVNTGPGIYIFTEVDQLYGIIMKSSIAYVGKTTRSLGSRAKEHFRDCVDPNFHHWLSKAEKNKKLKILFKRFPEKYLSNIEQFFIYKLNPIFNKIHNNGGKKYVR